MEGGALYPPPSPFEEKKKKKKKRKKDRFTSFLPAPARVGFIYLWWFCLFTTQYIFCVFCFYKHQERDGKVLRVVVCWGVLSMKDRLDGEKIR